jgi:hypothetical protein
MSRCKAAYSHYTDLISSGYRDGKEEAPQAYY